MGHSQSQARTGAYRVPDNGEGGDALLFVDVDGVLNSRNSVRANREAAESNAAAEARAEVRRNSLRRESSSSSSAAASPAKANPRPSNAASAPATTRSTYDEPVPFKCQLVRKIMDLTSLPDHQTRCVLSSTWRLDPRYLDRARDSLADAGVELYGCTNSFPCLTRVDEIVEFVERYNREHKRPARAWLAIDDMPLLQIALALQRKRGTQMPGSITFRNINFVQTSLDHGLTEVQAERAAAKIKDQQS